MYQAKRPVTITISNGKGGVGKTTLTRHIPFHLALKGYKCLVIDGDPQANLTKTMIITKQLYKAADDNEIFIIEKTLMAGIRDGKIDDLVVNVMKNLDVLPSHIDFKSYPTYLSKKFGVAEITDENYYKVEKSKMEHFKNLIDTVKPNYDFVFIDTPPTDSDFTRLASYSADYVLIAFQTHSDSLDGAKVYIEEQLSELVQKFDSKLEVVGILPNEFDSSGASDKKVIADAYEIFGEANMFKNIVKYTKRIQTIVRNGLSVEGYWNEQLANKTMIPITDELLERLTILESETNE
ncbi:ParA family protein [Brochothrix campestris]|uniref:ATPase, ParA family protein n=1 Tax=Brochothrix campestris FSL F6-1037 TaxID=1265861 RepID=W7CEC0_9LIST|nr:ParA family protein [Brochothrix campestris]EUJ34156.1 ATPase, ParA family protein [Brochothrix campestris FSL F6-1037]